MANQAPGWGYRPNMPPPGKLRPGRAWYLLALALVAGGIAWLVLSFIAFGNQVNSMPRAPLPQGGRVSLANSGGYVVYYEGPGAVTGSFAPFDVRVTPASPGAVGGGLHSYGVNATYTVGSHQGRAVLSLDVTRRSRQRAQLAGPVLGPGAPPYG